MSIRSAVTLASCLLVNAVVHAQALVPLPALPTGAPADIQQLSGDGSTLAAISNGTIYRYRSGAWESLANEWTPWDGAPNIFLMPPSGLHLSRNGLIVGATARTNESVGYYARVYRDNAWTSAETPSILYGLSADGSRYVGTSLFLSGTSQHVGTWNGAAYTVVDGDTTSVFPSEQRFSQGPLPGAADLRRFASISADGQTAIAYISGVGGDTIVRHGQAIAANVGRPAGIPEPLPGTEEFLVPGAISGDGNVITGFYLQNFTTLLPFRWTASTGSVLITLPARPIDELSFDGNMWVLSDGSIYFHNTATVLSAAQLLTAANISLVGWTDLRITQLSENGQTLAGFGTFNSPTGIITNASWVATIPTPSMLAMLAVTALASSRRKRTNV